jgi:hypothetical protein
MIYIQILYLILQLDKLYIYGCVFLAKTSYFIAVIIPLIMKRLTGSD